MQNSYPQALNAIECLTKALGSHGVQIEKRSTDSEWRIDLEFTVGNAIVATATQDGHRYYPCRVDIQNAMLANTQKQNQQNVRRVTALVRAYCELYYGCD